MDVGRYIPRPRSFFGRKEAIKKSRSYPNEDVVYTDEELEEEEAQMCQLDTSSGWAIVDNSRYNTVYYY